MLEKNNQFGHCPALVLQQCDKASNQSTQTKSSLNIQRTKDTAQRKSRSSHILLDIFWGRYLCSLQSFKSSGAGGDI